VVRLAASRTCNELDDGDIVDSAILFSGVPSGGKDVYRKDSGGTIFDREGTQVGEMS
jgi:hypothetical protein